MEVKGQHYELKLLAEVWRNHEILTLWIHLYMNVNKIVISCCLKAQFGRILCEALYCTDEIWFLVFFQSSPLTPYGWIMTYNWDILQHTAILEMESRTYSVLGLREDFRMEKIARSMGGSQISWGERGLKWIQWSQQSWTTSHGIQRRVQRSR